MNDNPEIEIEHTLRRMANYVLLIRWTDQGIRNIKDTINRAAAARKEVEKLGGKLTIYWTLGKYDLVGILEAPDDESAMQISLRFGSQGNVRTQTLRAFTEQETSGVISKLGLTA